MLLFALSKPMAKFSTPSSSIRCSWPRVSIIFLSNGGDLPSSDIVPNSGVDMTITRFSVCNFVCSCRTGASRATLLTTCRSNKWESQIANLSI